MAEENSTMERDYFAIVDNLTGAVLEMHARRFLNNYQQSIESVLGDYSGTEDVAVIALDDEEEYSHVRDGIRKGKVLIDIGYKNGSRNVWGKRISGQVTELNKKTDYDNKHK